jgi:hypothetical protein
MFEAVERFIPSDWQANGFTTTLALVCTKEDRLEEFYSLLQTKEQPSIFRPNANTERRFLVESFTDVK